MDNLKTKNIGRVNCKPYRFGLPRLCRLRSRKDILEIKKNGSLVKGKSFSMFYLPSSDGISKIAVVVSRKITKKAVVRNKLRRRVKEIFRLLRPFFVKPAQILIMAGPKSLALSYREIKKELITLWIKSGILKEQL